MSRPLAEPEIWNQINEGYTQYLRPAFEPFAVRAIELVQPQPHEDALDVACGPGTLCLKVAPRVRKVCAVDFAERMVSLAERAAVAHQVHNVELCVADGTRLPFEDQRFDIGFSCFGLFLFEDREAGFRELYRVLKPGARVCVTSWEPFAEEGPYAVLMETLQKMLPDIPLGGGASPLGTVEEMSTEMAAAGFERVEVHHQSGPLSAPDASRFWQAQVESSAPLVLLRNALSAAQWNDAARACEEALNREFVGSVTMDLRALLGVARKL